MQVGNGLSDYDPSLMSQDVVLTQDAVNNEDSDSGDATIDQLRAISFAPLQSGSLYETARSALTSLCELQRHTGDTVMEQDLRNTLAQLQARFKERALSLYANKEQLNGTIVSSHVAVDTRRSCKRIKRKSKARKHKSNKKAKIPKKPTLGSGGNSGSYFLLSMVHYVSSYFLHYL